MSGVRIVRRNWNVALCAVAVGALLFAGCIGNPANPAATQPVTAVDLATTQPEYWLRQPAVASAQSLSFAQLWHACEQTARDYLYALDREDYRQGLITTVPVASKQLFEVWRRDTGTLEQSAHNSLASIRRGIRFEIKKQDDGTFVMTPKVLVERETILERRLTSVVQYRYSFSGPAAPSHDAVDTEVPYDIPVKYWTPIGRDEQMERDVAARVRAKLR